MDAFLNKWRGKETAGERAEYQQFLTEFCLALGVPTPGDEGHAVEDYRFEAPVASSVVFGTKGVHRIDLYKRDHFILEAKQSRLDRGEASAPDPPPAPIAPAYDLLGHPMPAAPVSAKAPPRYDRLMADARIQAERYALALPEDHDPPPFLIVCDIGRSFELYWSANGRGYDFFPDQLSYRVELDDLASERKLGNLGKSARETLVAIWTDPASIDPRLRAAEVTRDIAKRLSRVAEQLEKDQRAANPGRAESELALGIEQTSLFLMRLLFCMFAEDVGLLPRESFKRFLAEAEDKSDDWWRSGLTELWSKMNDPKRANRFWNHGDAWIDYFNGNLFAATRIYDLPHEFKRELRVGAQQDWRAVEPAIFGTLLEQVLTDADRSKLGAHYTPRAYVERLVDAVIMDVLRPEWEAIREAVRNSAALRSPEDMATLRAFHDRLAAIRVLDPACGTGNFLYVAMEKLSQLEGQVIRLAAELGEALEPRVHPNQFLGLELNPRAAVIAELVLWIGWLRHRLTNHPQAIGEPVLPPLENINAGTHGRFDAVLALGPTGEADAESPRRPPWPEADFIIGNPPFIGGKDIRKEQGGTYAEALWRANPRVPPSADYVMQWWDRAADILTRQGTRLRRFGFVTTNSITQVFSRRVIEGWLHGSLEEDGLDKLSLILAIPDHPWIKPAKSEGRGRKRDEKGPAAVRIAMTVAEAGAREGRLIEVTGEHDLDTDEPRIVTRETIGRINADLSVGTDVTRVVPLKANDGICSRGVQLMGSGFIVTPAKARELGLGRRPGLEAHIRDYRNGRDLLQRPRGVMVIDLFGLGEQEVMERFPEVYQHLLKTVKPEREAPQKGGEMRVVSYAKRWWEFGVPRQGLRHALVGLSQYVATVETSKHRIFFRLPISILPDNRNVCFALESFGCLGILSSRLHTCWVTAIQATLEDRPIYTKSLIFDPFPFPDLTAVQRAGIAGIAERLDQVRRDALAENERLTMTGLYNLVEAVRSGTLAPESEREAVRARARIVAKLHDDLDAAVAAAYGWPGDLPPSEIVARLVTLNAERAAEEKAGQVRWLRPDYQASSGTR